MGVTGNTELAAVKQSVIAEIVQRELKFQSKLLGTITDVSMFATPGSKSIEFPKMASFTVEKRATGTAGTNQSLATQNDVLLLNERAHVQWLIDSNDLVQSRIAVRQEYIKRATSAHARGVDTDIATALVGASNEAISTAGMTKGKFLDMREALLEKEADLNNMVMVVSVAEEKAMLNIAEFTEADKYGALTIQNGLIGRIYGVPVLVSNNPTIKTVGAVMYDKASLAIGFQSGPNYSAQGKNEYGANAVQEVIDQLYGIKGMQIGEAGANTGKSPLIVHLHAAA